MSFLSTRIPVIKSKLNNTEIEIFCALPEFLYHNYIHLAYFQDLDRVGMAQWLACPPLIR